MAMAPPAKRRHEEEADIAYAQDSNNNGYPTALYAPPPPPTYYPSLPCPTPTGQPPPIADMISLLREQDLHDLLTQIVQTEPSHFAHALLTDTYTTHILAQRAKVIDFDHYSKSAWYTLNKSHYTKLSGSKQYDASWDAMAEVTGCIHAIAERATPETSYGTKLNALETLRGDCLTSEVRKQFASDHCLEDTVNSILEGMTVEERIQAGQNISEIGKPNLLEKMRWVHNDGDGYCIFEEIGYAVEVLEFGETEEEQDGEEEENEEEDYSLVVLNPIIAAAQPLNGLNHVITID
ncbi:hypothetical protein M409DRAFT_21844 [Zasmidium cellare ATCC 36951]|uniref:Uncharacterized protein n=1 Tax=Zasmidium cellare ATCC 36951 TaxID=1080233 RepID=A0A6A6CKX5_ZASCE|nr:uncharacterized protein M409DRAFT_21844 [Zasmidium cellare ATCC 36951]KAF2167691.1 hypothetical protein M409DRAFT_21844 [Zasmidium cellare ATCC 36951]